MDGRVRRRIQPEKELHPIRRIVDLQTISRLGLDHRFFVVYRDQYCNLGTFIKGGQTPAVAPGNQIQEVGFALDDGTQDKEQQWVAGIVVGDCSDAQPKNQFWHRSSSLAGLDEPTCVRNSAARSGIAVAR